MSPEQTKQRRKLPILQLAVLAIVLLGVALFLVRGVNVRLLEEQAVALMRRAGPWTFFSAAAILPAFGAPLLAFTVMAGELFAPVLTLGGVIAATLLAIGVNLALTYWLARYALRPLLSRLAERYGYKIPRVTKANMLSVALTVRLTPGPPFFMQSYILGLSEMPFRLYLVVSWLAILPWTLGAIILGKGVFNGNFKMAIYGVGLLIAATAIVQAVRKRYVNRGG